MSSKNLSDYLYQLPQDKIATEPVSPRDHSRLLMYKDQIIYHNHFYNLHELIPIKSLLIFNDTKVIPARLRFTKESGATIEIFLLEPSRSSVEKSLHDRRKTKWITLIGNKKRWKKGEVLQSFVGSTFLSAKLIDSELNEVEFNWENDESFSEILHITGDIPLPPYILRKSNPFDKNNYQTVYAKSEGAVAAPTAGLHFTEQVLANLKGKFIESANVTLHVGAGTFIPIKEKEDFRLHPMHKERVIIEYVTIQKLSIHLNLIVAVGTTSMRTLESLYWFGVLLSTDPFASFVIDQKLPYQKFRRPLPSRNEAFTLVKEFMDRHKITQLTGETKLFIYPEYEFKVCDALITNFHQPGSSLILLVASFVGEEWRKIYNEALGSDYRFLSYGDSSLLFKKQ